MKFYVASSWRNVYQPAVVQLLRERGHEVYDFRHPKPGDDGFSWSEVGLDWKEWTFSRYRDALTQERSEEGYKLDMDAMIWADVCLMVEPCGKSASMELGWSAGAGKKTAILYPVNMHATEISGHSFGYGCEACGIATCLLPGNLYRKFEPELMVKMVGDVKENILIGHDELITWLKKLEQTS